MMEEDHVTILELDVEPAYDVNNQNETDVVNLETLEPCMPVSVPFAYGACCLSPLEAFHENSILTDSTYMDKLQPPSTLNDISLSSAKTLSPYLMDTHLEDNVDVDKMSPYDLKGETAQSLYNAATATDMDPELKVEYAMNTYDIPEYKQMTTTPSKSVWRHYIMSDSDDSLLHEFDKENAESPHRSSPGRMKIKRSPKKKKKSKLNFSLNSKSYTPKAGSRCFTAEERLDLAKYCSIHGPDEAVEYFTRVWDKPVSKKVVLTAFEKYDMYKKSRHEEPTVEMMQATNKFTNVDRVQMAESCRKIGPTKTAKLFSEKLGTLVSESTVRGFAKKF